MNLLTVGQNRQIRLLTILNFCVGLVFWYGIEKVFLRDSLQIGPTGISQIVIVYMAVTLLLDVPAGVVADKWGRKKTLALALTFFVASNAVLGLSQDFTMYLLGTVLWGLFTVCFYGTYEALLYDSLKADGKQSHYQKVDATTRMWFMIGIAISSLVSGLMAQIVGLRGVYFVSIVPLIVGIYCVSRLVETIHHDDDETALEETKSHLQYFIAAFRDISASYKLRIIALGMVLFFLALTPLYEFAQYVYIALSHSTVMVGVLNGLSGVALALGFWIALHRVYNQYFLIITLFLAIALIGVFQNYFSVLCVFVACTVASLFENRIQTDLQHSTKSKNRASVTSAVNFIGTVLVVPVIVVFGAIAEKSIWLAYAQLSILLLVVVSAYITVQRLSLRRYETAEVEV